MVYTTVEKSTGHEKKGVSQLCLVENATLDRWVFTLGEENNGGELFLMDDKMTWPPYVAALFGVGLLRRRSFLSGLKRPEKPNSIEIFYCL